MKSSRFWVFLILLSGVLAFLFRDGFLPGLAGFANDAPLGLMQAYNRVRWEYFFGGSWIYHCWVGGSTLNTLPNFSHGLYLLAGAVPFAKFAAVVSLLFLGVSLWFLCRSLGFGVVPSVLTGLAGALNGNLLSHATWGLGSRAATVGFAAVALGLLSRGTEESCGFRRWSWLLLGGFATGMTVMEGADVGALLSLCIGAYVMYQASLDSGDLRSRLGRGFLRLAVVTVCAAWIASYAITSLVGTQLKGVAVLSENEGARAQRWDFITGWSFPKLEVVRIAIPGIMGYRMDTPEGGAYWGNVGQDGTPAFRFNGGGEYAGVLVLMVAGWAVARAFSRSARQPFSERDRRLIGFWLALCVVSLLLSFGRFAPFYHLIYALPYLSTIRVPMKFLHLMHFGLFVLFAYGLQGLWRLYAEGPAARGDGMVAQVTAWWRTATGFDRGWSRALLILSAGSLAAALIYSAFVPSIARYISSAGFPGEGEAMATFSAVQVGLFAVVVVLSAAVLALLASGRFGGGRGMTAACLLGGLLVVDLGRAAVPFVHHYNYQRRYEANPVVSFLARTPWEHRVTARLFPDLRQTLASPQDGTWPAVQNQWMEQQFPFNGIHTADIWQMPRMPELDSAYLKTFRPVSNDDLGRIGRLWQLANVRYIIGARGTEGELNRLFDPVRKSFKPVLGFDLAPKPGSPPGGRMGLDDITAIVNPTGQYAVIEYGGALPRAGLYPRWEVIPDNAAALKRLEDASFDPAVSVVLDAPPVRPGGGTMAASTNAPAVGSTESLITEWDPKRVVIRTACSQDAVLLLNDRWDPDWHVTVDGTPATLVRANSLMRGVGVPAGKHVVEFRYQPPMSLLWVTLSAVAVALGTCAGLVVGLRRSEG